MKRPVFKDKHTGAGESASEKITLKAVSKLKHPLYGKLPSWAKKTFDGLSEDDKIFQIKNNKSESQILNALGDISGRTPKMFDEKD